MNEKVFRKISLNPEFSVMKRLYFFLLFLSFLTSCQTDDPLDADESTLFTTAQTCTISDSESVPPQFATEKNIGSVTIGRKLDKYLASFTIQYMGDALMSLKWRRTAVPGDERLNKIANELFISPYDLRTTHYYVEIVPKTAEDLELLSEDSTLYCTPLPFDHEIKGTGTIAHAPAEYDPETGDMKIVGPLNPVYSIVPITRRMPDGIEYQILAHLYMPHMTDATLAEAAGTPLLSDTFAELLVDQALFLSGAKTSEELGSEKSWRPSGQIQVYDTKLNEYVGVPSIRVHIVGNGRDVWEYTDARGSFRLSSDYANFKGPVKFEIEWATKDYIIHNSAREKGYYYCGTQHYPLDLKITNGEARGIATVARALSSHYYGSNNIWERITQFRHSSSWRGRFNIYYNHCYKPKKQGEFNYFSSKYIHIWGKNIQIKEVRSEYLLKTVFHEMAHATMYFRCKKLGKSYDDFRKMMRESWADFIGWYMTESEYQSLGWDHTKDCYEYIDEQGKLIYLDEPNDINRQQYNQSDFESGNHYTSLFIDFLDSTNQKTLKEIDVLDQDITVPDDRIELTSSPEHYNMFYIIAIYSKDIFQFKANILEYADRLGIDEQDINDYFAFYGI